MATTIKTVKICKDVTIGTYFCRDDFNSKKEWLEFLHKVTAFNADQKIIDSCFYDNVSFDTDDILLDNGKVYVQIIR